MEEIVAAVTLSPDQLARRDALSAQVATPQESLKALTALHPIISTAAPALALAEAAMTRTSTFSHDNPIAPTDTFPEPKDIEADLKELEDVVAWLKKHHDGVG